MRFFHVGDLHFGKALHHVPLIEEDQPFWVEKLLQAADEYRPDAIVIAGDVYDRRVPSPEAMKLFSHLLTGLAERGMYVFVIPGNHDSAARLGHVRELLTSHKIFIAGELTGELTHVTVSGAGPDVTFWLMPYVFPRAVSDERVLNRPDITTYDGAVRALLAAQRIDRSVCNVLAAHQNVLANGAAPEHSDSETIVGGIGEVEVSAFEAFDYVALGHIHNAQKVGRETVRYSGCPLYYDFSEINRRKPLTLVDIRAKDDIRIGQIDIPLRRRLRQEAGTLEELLEAGRRLEDRNSYYVQCILRDRHVPPRAMEQLREAYGDCLVHVKREWMETQAAGAESSVPRGKAAAVRPVPEQFALFYQEQQQELPDGSQEELIGRISEQQARSGDDYVSDMKAVPEEDSRELVELLLEMAGKELG